MRAEIRVTQGYTPFEGVELTRPGEVDLLRGALIYDNGNVVGPAKGQYLRRPIIK